MRCLITIRNEKEKENILTKLGIYMLVTSLLEAYPPLGPGTSCMIFWLLTGFSDRIRR